MGKISTAIELSTAQQPSGWQSQLRDLVSATGNALMFVPSEVTKQCITRARLVITFSSHDEQTQETAG
jgi:hypothetical protein